MGDPPAEHIREGQGTCNRYNPTRHEQHIEPCAGLFEGGRSGAVEPLLLGQE